MKLKKSVIIIASIIFLIGCTSSKFNHLINANTNYKLALESYNSVVHIDSLSMKNLDNKSQKNINMAQDNMTKSARILLLSAKESLEPLKRDNLSEEDRKKYDELINNIETLNKKLNQAL